MIFQNVSLFLISLEKVLTTFTNSFTLWKKKSAKYITCYLYFTTFITNMKTSVFFFVFLSFQCCPGFARTDMSSGKGNRSADEAAVTPVYLALLPPGCKDPHGKMLVDKKLHDFW